MTTKQCVECGKPMQAHRAGRERKYCSPSCANKARRSQQLERSHRERADIADHVVDLLLSGLSPEHVLRAVGSEGHVRALHRRLKRAGRPDAAKPFAALASRERRAREKQAKGVQ